MVCDFLLDGNVVYVSIGSGAWQERDEYENCRNKPFAFTVLEYWLHRVLIFKEYLPFYFIPVSNMNIKRERTKTVDLGAERTRTLIQFIQAIPYLWNSNDPLYKNKKSQAEAWESISEEMGVPVPELRHKWASLQSSFRHFLVLYQKGRASQNCEGGQLPRRRWNLYDDMLFLLASGKERTPERTVIKQNNDSTEDMDQSMDAVSHLADTKTATGNSLEMSGQNPIERTVPPPWAAVSRTPIRKQINSRHVSSVVVRQDLYAKRKVMYQTNPTYQRRKSNEPDDASPGTTTQKDDRVTNSYCDALRYGQNVGRVLAQLSPQRRHAVMIKIDEILLDTAKERYQQQYGADP
uniref:uncharacterized protein LOC120951023 n=1 Tax=Anopheles coluzzii TaxID=1518534 RepID=UPI0020FFCCF5|nr:uncharacterized protein LOC120951023 [Anopheles coluzzii]